MFIFNDKLESNLLS